ncbi:hypothetical protein CYY_007665 [Polysphondylium violaceum]|uniref:Uncharacterized protein n=1 Tax=Polysphondylium violaceum TaxID=133409 RepID=A0A8J4PNC5_9MYCE|nr:hypothetical protein CYY_007665 [Polysphondylium violaceum]
MTDKVPPPHTTKEFKKGFFNTLKTMLARNSFLKDPAWMDAPMKPVLSITKFRVIASTLGAFAFYCAIVSEYYDSKGNVQSTVTDGFRRKHDAFMSNLLGFDVREKIRGFQAASFKLTSDKDNSQEIDKNLQNLKNDTTTTTTGVNRKIQPSSKFSTLEEERVDILKKKSEYVTMKLEKQVEEQFNNILLKQEERDKKLK